MATIYVWMMCRLDRHTAKRNNENEREWKWTTQDDHRIHSLPSTSDKYIALNKTIVGPYFFLLAENRLFTLPNIEKWHWNVYEQEHFNPNNTYLNVIYFNLWQRLWFFSTLFVIFVWLVKKTHTNHPVVFSTAFDFISDIQRGTQVNSTRIHDNKIQVFHAICIYSCKIINLMNYNSNCIFLRTI